VARTLARAEATRPRAALRSTVAQAQSAREGMEADAKQAAELAERLSEVLTRNMEADLAQKHVAALQRATAAAIANSMPPEGGQAEGARAAPPPPPPESRVGSGDRGAGGA
jgi:phenylpyruvate tautomerase PptA (4-oxalocrotonate tautomerase family)